VHVGAGGAAVLEVLEREQRLLHDVVTRDVVEAGDEGDAAGVVLVARVVEAVRPCRESGHHGSGSGGRSG